jgi:hypothetical protein
MNQWTQGYYLTKKTRGRKSRATVPLRNLLVRIQNIILRDHCNHGRSYWSFKCFTLYFLTKYSFNKNSKNYVFTAYSTVYFYSFSLVQARVSRPKFRCTIHECELRILGSEQGHILLLDFGPGRQIN